MSTIGKNALIRLITKEYGWDQQLISLLAKMSDEELAKETGSSVLRKGYFVR